MATQKSSFYVNPTHVGSSFNEFLTKNLSEEELIAKGLNICATHVDIMIGTSDLKIEAETNQGKKLIFKKGNFNL